MAGDESKPKQSMTEKERHPYILRPVVFEFRALLDDTVRRLREMLSGVDARFEIDALAGRLIVMGEGRLDAAEHARVRQALDWLGDQATRAAMIEEWYADAPNIEFVGPTSGAIHSLRREFSSRGWQRLRGHVCDVFEELPGLVGFRTWLTDSGLQLALSVSHVTWKKGARREVTPAELARRVTDLEIEIDLSLLDGRGFFRDDFARLRAGERA